MGFETDSSVGCPQTLISCGGTAESGTIESCVLKGGGKSDFPALFAVQMASETSSRRDTGVGADVRCAMGVATHSSMTRADLEHPPAYKTFMTQVDSHQELH